MKLSPHKQLQSKKVPTRFYARIRSRHPSHDTLRRNPALLMPFKSVVRLGSTTTEHECDICCNTPEAVSNSSSKLRMKQCFTRAGVVTAPWWTVSSLGGGYLFHPFDNRQQETDSANLPYPLIVKSHNGSRGRGNSKINNSAEMQTFINNNNMENYIVEQYKSFLREYRLHVTREGCFYTCRKMLKRDTPEDKKFQRHDDNCVWILEENPQFDKPINWNDVVADCVKALDSLGLDIGAFDLKIQAARDKEGNINRNPEWIVIESCSAPSFGEVTARKYMEEIPKILQRKYNESRGV